MSSTSVIGTQKTKHYTSSDFVAQWALYLNRIKPVSTRALSPCLLDPIRDMGLASITIILTFLVLQGSPAYPWETQAIIRRCTQRQTHVYWKLNSSYCQQKPYERAE